jgi:predicted secreted protein
MTTVKVEESAEPVETRLGEVVTLEVPGANTAGYLWQLQTNSDTVKVVGHEVVPDEENFGGAGVERFCLQVLKEGDATVYLRLKRPWEQEAAESYDVHLHSVSK